MSENRTDLENAALALYYYAAELIKEGKSEKEVISTLIDRGVTRETAETMLERLNVSRANVARRSGYRNALFGGALVILTVLPLFGIFVEQPVGFSQILTILLLAVGVVMLGRGLMQIFGI